MVRGMAGFLAAFPGLKSRGKQETVEASYLKIYQDWLGDLRRCASRRGDYEWDAEQRIARRGVRLARFR